MSETVKAADNRGEQDVILEQINARPEQVTAGHTKPQRGSAIPQWNRGPDLIMPQQITILHLHEL